MKTSFAHFCVLVFAAMPALAFFAPEDSRDGVTARFVGFDEASGKSGLVAARRDAGEPFEIRLDIANATGAPVSGDLAFWLNDDWEIRGGSPDAQALSCAIPPHSTNFFFATAVPRSGRVLPALYPIHASFSLPGGKPLHPIAIFLANVAKNGGYAPEPLPLPLRLAHPRRGERAPGAGLPQVHSDWTDPERGRIGRAAGSCAGSGGANRERARDRVWSHPRLTPLLRENRKVVSWTAFFARRAG